MSMMYCHSCDGDFDSDYHINCPGCAARDAVFCYYCSRGYAIDEYWTEEEFEKSNQLKCPKCGENVDAW